MGLFCFVEDNIDGKVNGLKKQLQRKGIVDLYSPCCYPEPVELPMADWLESSTDWTSPPCSPLHWDSPPSTPFAWESEVIEFVLKQEVDI
ncbi:hypothetical protein RGQ29_001290 [Quercus rubra]|uniref:Uncharacterized protein n=1 Tax=Quercus rubra TaxID=3512 RepID=A0AAN7G5G1_QUERU|nr:hypothetical protein RGQ29_001290 [Quercus rubra]